MSTTFKAVALAAAGFAMLGGVGAAEAHGIYKQHGPRLRIVIGGGGYGYGCGYLYDRWQFTGSRYWKREYFACLYGY